MRASPKDRVNPVPSLSESAETPHESRSKVEHHLTPTHSNMSDNGEVEVENPSGYQVLPKEVVEEIGSIKLFNKWSYEDVEIRDISLT